jgi:hypothetical protein
MLHEFPSKNREELIERCIAKVALRPTRIAIEKKPEFGVPIFLDQLIKTLELEQTSDPAQSFDVSGPSGGTPQGLSEWGRALHATGGNCPTSGIRSTKSFTTMGTCPRQLRISLS